MESKLVKEAFFVNRRQGERRLINSSVPCEKVDNGVNFKYNTKDHWMSNDYMKELETTLENDLAFFQKNKDICLKLEKEWQNNILDVSEEIQQDFADFDFHLDDDRVLDLVRTEKQKSWRNVERDITIFQERKNGALLDDLALKYNIDFSSVSVIATKVEKTINYYKGKLFEHEYFRFLEKSKRFDKVEKMGASGEPDLIAHDLKKDALYIFSLKNLKMKKSYTILNEELSPEYKYAYESSFKFKEIHLILVVFNNFDNTIEEIVLDYKNPKHITLR